ncbi:MAG: PAS domain-containing protein [Egibacteraceae bacterium]
MGDNRQVSDEGRGVALRSAVFDAALDALLVADGERRYVDANAAACALLGRTRDELLALRVEDVSPMGADVAGAWAAFIAQGEATGSYTLVRPDGSTVPVDFRATANVTPGRHLSVLRDVSERRRLEGRLQALFDQAPDIIYRYRLEPEPGLEFISGAVERITGHSVQELIGEPIAGGRLIHPDDQAPLAHALAGRADSQPLLIRMRARDASVRWTEHRVVATHEDGRHVASEGVARDVTDRVTGDALAARRAREQAVLVELGELALTSRAGSVCDAACALVADTMGVEVAAVGQFGADVETVLVLAGVGLPDGMAGELRLPLDDGSLAGRAFHSRMSAVLDNRLDSEAPGGSLIREFGLVDGVSVLVGGASEPFGVLVAGCTSSRTFSPQETTFLQTVANVLGEVVERDRISDERDKASEELARREHEFRTLAEHSPDIIVRVNRDLRLAYVSPSVERITTKAASSFIGRPVSDLGHPSEVGTLWERALRQVVANREATTIEFTLQGANTPVHYEALLTPEFAADGTVETVLLISHDVTERRATETLRRRALTQVLEAQEAERAHIAEDIHDDSIQVMVVVGLRLETLKGHLSDEKARGLVDQLGQTVSRSIERLRALMFELRPPELNRIGLPDTLRLHLETNSEGMPSWEVTDDLPSPLPPNAVGVLYRIALEALANVRKHAHASLVRIMLDESRGGVRLRVHDDGLGFNHGDASADGPHHIGMVAMRERAEGAGGWLDVTSGPGEGTTVTAWIPTQPPTGGRVR